MRPGAIGAALAVNLVLLAGLAFLWSDDERRHWAEPAALAPSLGEPAAAAAAEPVEVSRYRETVERPLFAANRRPGPRKDAEAEAEARDDALKDVRLIGTYGAGERGGIIVVSGGKVQRVPVGESIGGWKVAGGGEGRSAELVRANGDRRQLELALNTAAPALPAAAGKEGAQPAAVAGAAAAAEPVGSSPGTAQSSPFARGSGARAGSASPGAVEDRLRERQEWMLQRRQRARPGR